ncbi:MAG: ATP-binding protein [Sulfitobacter sp.]|nr:ATP-binding protein [Sulfitobacter sp.]
MQTTRQGPSPTLIMLAAAGLALAFTILAIVSATGRPYLDLPAGAQLEQVGAVELIPTDFYPEPDHLGTYPAMRTFFDRQSLIADQLDQPQVAVRYLSQTGESRSETLTPRPRTLADLPFPFWFQQGVGILALLTGGWVLSLRRKDWGARMFGFTALFIPVFAIAASVYSTRQIALPGDTFKLLSQINHFGAGAFGIALVGLFMMYPRPMVRARWLLLPAVIFGTGILLDLAYVGQDIWLNLVVPAEMLLAIILGIVQWWRTRGDPLGRAGLRWFFLFSLVGCSLFVSLSVMPPALGLSEQGYIPQAFAFGFFNLMHIGLALGVTRWRVFELDRYAYYVWLWLAGAVLIFATDLLLLLWLRDQPWASLTLALILASFLYFPLRQLLLVRLFRATRANVDDLVPQTIDVALAPTRALRQERWDELLHHTFAPAAAIEPLPQAPDRPEIRENGVALHVPALLDLEGRQLRYPSGGRRLFNSEDVRAAATLVQMHRVVSESHHAYERGVNVERDRISRDVHDNIGAQLLSALHAREGSRKDALLRDTLTDLRQIISDGFRSEFRFADVAADLRAEMADRLEAHDITLDWPTDTLQALDGLGDQRVPVLLVNTLRSILREAASNIIKHAAASSVAVSLTRRGDSLEVRIADDGRGFDPAQAHRGEGLNNMEERVSQLGGDIDITRQAGQTRIRAALPLDLYSAQERAAAAQ